MGDLLDRSSMDQDELTKMSSKQKAVFTRKLGELEDKIENFQTVPTSQKYEEQCFTAGEALRERYENVVLTYEEIQTRVTDEIWKSTFETKMKEVITNFKKIEKKLAGVVAQARENAESTNPMNLSQQEGVKERTLTKVGNWIPRSDQNMNSAVNSHSKRCSCGKKPGMLTQMFPGCTMLHSRCKRPPS